MEGTPRSLHKPYSGVYTALHTVTYLYNTSSFLKLLATIEALSLKESQGERR